MQLNRVRAISFDLDDTLWPFQSAVDRAEEVLREWLIDQAPATAQILTVPMALKAYRSHAEAAHPELQHNLSGLRKESIRALLRDAGEDTDLAERAYEVFLAQRLRVKPYVDVVPALTGLAARFPLVALSNGNGCVHAAGLGGFFLGVLNASNLATLKPGAQAFQQAASVANVRVDELLHVGDDPDLDFAGAIAAGAQAVLVVRGDQVVAPREILPTVTSLMQLCNAFELASVQHMPE